MFGFYRVAAAVPKVRVADVNFNVEQIIGLWRIAAEQKSAAVLFPELGICGYSCGDLFLQKSLHDAAMQGLKKIVNASKTNDTIGIVSLPLWYKGCLYDCAAVVQSGNVLGVVPKSVVPEHKEYYEKRWFSSGKNVINKSISLFGQEVPFGVDLLFEGEEDFSFGIEICEDLWSVIPPSSYQAINGSLLTFNPSASDEIVTKSKYRAKLVSSQSARCMSGYIYASCGMGESTTDVVFGGDAIIAENGAILARSKRFIDDSKLIFADLDLQRLKYMRLSESSFCDNEPSDFRCVKIQKICKTVQLNRMIESHPFVPFDKSKRDDHCEEIFSIQSAALQKRMDHIGSNVCILGISGGLDSTLALLAIFRAYLDTKRDPKQIICVTMPGFGTTSRTLKNAVNLCIKLGVTLHNIDIKQACLEHFKQIGHDPAKHSIVYENVQARERTQILMDIANEKGGIVIGTGDLSESALGWSTYNGDHMSMYSINVGIPKTLIRYLIEWSCTVYEDIAPILRDILDTPVSPELLPSDKGEITQKTEEVVGPYELHDFFLYHMIKSGATPAKILFLAERAFKGKYNKKEIKSWLVLFLRRFFSQQFKRSCMPDGPKVGTISLSPRGDWRMPSDAVVDIWIDEIGEEK